MLIEEEPKPPAEVKPGTKITPNVGKFEKLADKIIGKLKNVKKKEIIAVLQALDATESLAVVT